MRCRFWSDTKRGLRGERGSVAVEFALLAPVFLLLVFGIIDFGHAFYMQQMVSNGSREGARYGTRYNTSDAGTHLFPNALSPTIASYVSSQYSPLLPDDANLQVTPGGAGFTSGAAGADLNVTVTATKHWWVLGSLIPGLGTTKNISVTTCMKVE
jgi:Flp pilus assembly protein TadG